LKKVEAPEAGGATVFPNAGARVATRRRGATFWYNLHPSGQGDERTMHAGCPVLLGTKWISNKWFHYGGQELIKPCGAQMETEHIHWTQSFMGEPY
jgi:prolyl 4-hydroxylase